MNIIKITVIKIFRKYRYINAKGRRSLFLLDFINLSQTSLS